MTTLFPGRVTTVHPVEIAGKKVKMKQVFKVSGMELQLDASGQKRVTHYDRGDNPITVQMFGGTPYNCFYPVAHLERIEKFTLRDDDIYLPGFLRTGTHWTFEIASMLLKQKAETIQFWKGFSQLENSPPGFLENMASPRAIHCHMDLFEAPRELKELKCKIVINQRDPRDVALSLYKMSRDAESITGYTGHFEDFFYLFLEGKVDCNGILEHALKCERFLAENPDIPVHVIYYEDALKDAVTTVRELSDFLGLPGNDELCAAIADKCQFTRMSEDKKNFSITVDDHEIIFGKGVSGRWKEHFTEDMLQDYYRLYEEKMAGSRFFRKQYARP